jgi:hypothetical protein
MANLPKTGRDGVLRVLVSEIKRGTDRDSLLKLLVRNYHYSLCTGYQLVREAQFMADADDLPKSRENDDIRRHMTSLNRSKQKVKAEARVK